MKTSMILKLAKTHLAKNAKQADKGIKELYICYAISEIQAMGLITSEESREVRGIIRERLGSNTTLEDWLENIHCIPAPGWAESEKVVRKYENKIQQTRHAWVDSMIAEFSAKGD